MKIDTIFHLHDAGPVHVMSARVVPLKSLPTTIMRLTCLPVAAELKQSCALGARKPRRRVACENVLKEFAIFPTGKSYRFLLPPFWNPGIQFNLKREGLAG